MADFLKNIIGGSKSTAAPAPSADAGKFSLPSLVNGLAIAADPSQQVDVAAEEEEKKLT